MKSDLSAIIKEAGLDAIMIIGSSVSNPPLKYFTGDAFFTSAIIVIPQSGEPTLVYRPMERDNAAKTGMKTISIEAFPLKPLLEEAEGDLDRAEALQWIKILKSVGVEKGKISFCGTDEFGKVFNKVLLLSEAAPEYEILPDQAIKCLQNARFTKDSAEIESIRNTGNIVVGIVAQVESFLRSCHLVDNLLYTPDGDPVRIGDIKRMINLKLIEAGAENPERTIFAMGRDAAVPHNGGNGQDIIQGGKTIVFDFFPRDAGSGYFYDFTRTWCIGYADEKIQNAYNQVKQVHDEVIAMIKPGMPLKQLQNAACEKFRAMGHKTVKEAPGTFEGYVHSVSHGLGLDVHERPFSGFSAPDKDTADLFTVFTVEPGLYYPEGEVPFGIRIEDTLCIDKNGRAAIMAEYPYQLVIPVQSSEGK